MLRVKCQGGTKNKIYLKGGYSENNLDNLSTFIHEATHIWQRRTELHRDKGDGNYKYTDGQLVTLELSNEEHAEAVQNWFYVTWGLKAGQIDARAAWNHLYKNNLSVESLIENVRQQGNQDPLGIAPFNNVQWTLNHVGAAYANVINEIRSTPIRRPAYRGRLWR